MTADTYYDSIQDMMYERAIHSLYNGMPVMPWERELLAMAPLPEDIVDPFASQDSDPLQIMGLAYKSLVTWIDEARKANYFTKRFTDLSKLVLKGVNTMGRGLMTLHNRGEDLSQAPMQIGDLISVGSYHLRKSYLGVIQTASSHPEISERLLMNQLSWTNMLLRLYKTKEKLAKPVLNEEVRMKNEEISDGKANVSSFLPLTSSLDDATSFDELDALFEPAALSAPRALSSLDKGAGKGGRLSPKEEPSPGQGAQSSGHKAQTPGQGAQDQHIEDLNPEKTSEDKTPEKPEEENAQEKRSGSEIPNTEPVYDDHQLENDPDNEISESQKTEKSNPAEENHEPDLGEHPSETGVEEPENLHENQEPESGEYSSEIEAEEPENLYENHEPDIGEHLSETGAEEPESLHGSQDPPPDLENSFCSEAADPDPGMPPYLAVLKNIMERSGSEDDGALTFTGDEMCFLAADPDFNRIYPAAAEHFRSILAQIDSG